MLEGNDTCTFSCRVENLDKCFFSLKKISKIRVIFPFWNGVFSHSRELKIQKFSNHGGLIRLCLGHFRDLLSQKFSNHGGLIMLCFSHSRDLKTKEFSNHCGLIILCLRPVQWFRYEIEGTGYSLRLR